MALYPMWINGLWQHRRPHLTPAHHDAHIRAWNEEQTWFGLGFVSDWRMRRAIAG